MNFKEGIEKIKVLMASIVAPTEPTPAPEPPAPAQKFEEVKTAEGQVLTIDKLEVGGNVLIDGVAAPDGEYKLESGGKLSVVGGMVSELELEPAPASTEAVAPEAMTTPEQFKKVIEKFADPAVSPDIQKLALVVKALFERQFGWELREAEERASRDAAISVYKQGFSKQTEATNQMVELLEQFSNQSIQKPTAPTKSWDDMTPLERFKFHKQLEDQKQN